MTQAATEEDRAATGLLARYGTAAAHRGSPIWFEALLEGPGPVVTKEVRGRDGLMGRVVGRRWDAAALVATGRVRVLDEAHELSAAMASSRDGGLCLACVVSRRGTVGWRVRLADGTHHDQAPDEGFMLDILRRGLRLPTPPPPAIVGLDLVRWVEAIEGTAETRDGRLSWADVVLLHPATYGVPGLDTAAAVACIESAPLPAAMW